jgi:hypothetical protein
MIAMIRVFPLRPRNGTPEQTRRRRRADALALIAEEGVRSYPSWIAELRSEWGDGIDRCRYAYEHLGAGDALELVRERTGPTATGPYRITIVPFTSVTFPSNTIGLPRRSTTGFASRSSSKRSSPAGSDAAQNLSGRGSSLSMTGARPGCERAPIARGAISVRA